MKQMTNFKRSLSLALCVLLLAAAALGTTGCSNSNSSNNSSSVSSTVSAPSSSSDVTSLPDSSGAAASDSTAPEAEVLGEGENSFPLTVTDGDGKTMAYLINTDETTVGAALQALGLIEGEDSEYGLYVKSVCGITADYDVDGTYWAFYVDGEYASTGVDSTEIVAGSSYALRVEKG